MTVCIKCKLEYDERHDEDCETCRHTEAMFRAWKDVTHMGIAADSGSVVDFDEDIYEKHPILTTLKYEPCNNIFQLERYIRLRLQNILINRQKAYKRKRGVGVKSWESGFTSTPIWKKDPTGKRRAPLVSATCFDIGEKMKGKGGIMYVVKRKKDGSQFWVRYRSSLLAFTAGERWPPIGEMRGAVVMHHGIHHGR